jgi:hypothetical protein
MRPRPQPWPAQIAAGGLFVLVLVELVLLAAVL